MLLIFVQFDLAFTCISVLSCTDFSSLSYLQAVITFVNLSDRLV